MPIRHEILSKTFPRALRGPFENQLTTRLSASQALCRGLQLTLSPHQRFKTLLS